ncbi:MAG: hypothetical protein ABJO57_10075 [Lentilitoribacter sp.]
MVDDPKKAFNERGNSNFRDKDNAKPDLKPKFSSRPAPNLAPAGMRGIQAMPQFPKREINRETALVSIVKTHPKPELLTGGRFMDKEGHSFAVEVNPFRTFTGIESGKITALEIQQEGKIIAQYKDAQWTKIPEKNNQIELVQRLQDQFGEPRNDFIPIVPLSQDKDQGHDR